MIAYISGPMTGYPDFNFPAFAAAAATFRGAGWTILSPHENFGGDQTRDYLEYLRADMEAIRQAEAIILLPGWPSSNGARWELQIALGLKLKVYFFDPQDQRRTVMSQAMPQ